MSFRFQKRVRVAPGVRLNISKRGISTSIGPRGTSLTLGKRGLYGNVGIPGSGLSYRTRIDRRTGNRLFNVSHRQNTYEDVQLSLNQQDNNIQFMTKTGDPLPSSLEKKLYKEFSSEIEEVYREKEQQVNAQTEQLLQLHHQVFHPFTFKELQQLINKTVSFDEQPPDQKTIYQKVKQEHENQLNLLTRLSLFLPSKRKEFEETISTETEQIFHTEMEDYHEQKTLYIEEKQKRERLLNAILQHDSQATEEWLALHLEELDFPLETNVDFQMLNETTIYFDVDLPELEEVPLEKATILKSGKLKVQEKSQRETREHYALMVGGTALYLCSFAFAFVPNIDTVVISGYTQRLNESTGHKDDTYIYSLIVERDRFYSLNMSAVHPILAFENFKHRLNTTKTFIFKEIVPYSPDEFVE
ncbi:DUF4236 domain-containing protein [Alkalihalobacterium alkalinitrilicum]|uniref:DUF4236 domain-containing protein n=1 Tax=Alkalihalobacterium alkalinitrilicum TaxID=427920 RepID=UPI000994A011|nr:DUF4236 domain-containing protein [Alkalihalobacterium alkalinitrilicum]